MSRDNGPGLQHLAGHLILLAATASLLWFSRGGAWWPVVLVVHGLVLVFLFAPLHESLHRTAFRTRWLNDITSWFCGAVLLLLPRAFRAFHFAHHGYTQDPVCDPELAVPKPATPGQYLLYISGLPYWYAQLRELLTHAIGRVGEPWISAKLRARVIREARIYLCVYSLLAALSLLSQSTLLLQFWLLPVLAGQPFLRLYLLAEHGGCPQVAEMLRNSRTTRSNAAIRWLAWNMPYHAEHHAYPSVPFHALPALHRLIGERVEVQASGYLAVHAQILSAMLSKRDSAM